MSYPMVETILVRTLMMTQMMDYLISLFNSIG